MKVVVLGSNSFSGASFVKRVLRESSSAIGISRSPEPIRAFLPYRWADTNSSGFTFHQGDLNHDLDRIMEIIEEFEPDYVVNFAAQSMVAESWQYPEHWYQTNVVANVKLHDRLRRLSGLQKYVHVSTPEVYGNCTGNVTEDAPFNPSTPYAVSRAACDLHLKSFFRNYGFPVAFTRAANVYGPGQQLYRIIPRTILSIKMGRKLPLHGGGHSVRSFIHINDVAEGTLRVVQHAAPGEVYHFSTPVHVSIREIVELICRKMGVAFEEVVEVVGDRPAKDAAYRLDSEKARHDLDWTPSISLDDGIEESIGWVADHYEELKTQPLDYIHKP